MDYSELTSDELHELLYEKCETEYYNFIDFNMGLSPREIINNAYEMVIKSDFLSCLEYVTFPREKVIALCNLESPLQAMYRDWMDKEDSHMETIKGIVIDLADRKSEKTEFDKTIDKIIETAKTEMQNKEKTNKDNTDRSYR